MIRAIIFDFNGVLVDDEAVHFELFREVLAEEGITITERQYHERYLGYDDRGCFAAVLDDHQHPIDDQNLDELVERKARRYVRVADKGLRYFPHAAETLKTLAVHWPLAICSGALRAEIEYALEHLNCRDCITGIIAAEDAHKCKPDPAGYLQALDLLQDRGRGRAVNDPVVGSRECLVVEDSLAGVISAKAAGMWAVGISHTYTADQLLESGADTVIHSLSVLTPEWIRDGKRWRPDVARSSSFSGQSG
ncbi:MAG: HAD family hydrolase [Isosphaeraceae bacterium]